MRLEVCGDSFMLHQIRHMVGAAVAIVRGILPRVSLTHDDAEQGADVMVVAAPRCPAAACIVTCACSLSKRWPVG